MFLTHHPAWKEVIVLEEFSNRVLKRKPPPWGGQLGEWDSDDDFRLGLWLAQQQGLLVRNINSITEGVHAAAVECALASGAGILRSRWCGTARRASTIG